MNSDKLEALVDTYRSGQPADYGMYISIRPPDVRFVGEKGEAIAGRDGADYYRVPTLLTPIVALALGGVFVAAFPTLIFYTAFNAVYRTIAHSADQHAYVAQARFQPAASYLNHPGDGSKASEPDPEIANLEAEVQARRDDDQG